MDAIETTVNMSMAEAETAVRQALSEQGFGVLTEIDVAATLAAKLGVDRPALKILGACNPAFAHRSLQLDPTVALLLPCNVVLEATDDEGKTRVAIADPRELIGSLASPRRGDLEGLADEAATALEVAVAKLKG
jgi:uncharacterized protein (DUF302 family)